jgi:hypothetical protein
MPGAWLTMPCRAPEIVPWWPEGYGPDKPYINEGEVYQHHRCVNCDRAAYACGNCGEIRCDSWLWKSMVGSFPLGCQVCMPNGIEQEFEMGPGPHGIGGGTLRWKPRP